MLLTKVQLRALGMKMSYSYNSLSEDLWVISNVLFMVHNFKNHLHTHSKWCVRFYPNADVLLAWILDEVRCSCTRADSSTQIISNDNAVGANGWGSVSSGEDILMCMKSKVLLVLHNIPDEFHFIILIQTQPTSRTFYTTHNTECTDLPRQDRKAQMLESFMLDSWMQQTVCVTVREAL